MQLIRLASVIVGLAMMSFVSHNGILTHTMDEAHNVAIYPNPLSDDVMYLEAEHEGLISIFTVKGEKVFVDNYERGVNKYDISHIAPGEYIFKIVSDGSMSIASFNMTRN